MNTDQLVRLLGEKFISRKDAFALQASDGQWIAKREPMTMKLFESHLSGERSVGHYLLSKENTTKLFAFDLDLDQEYREEWRSSRPEDLRIQLRCMAEGLAFNVWRRFGLDVAVLDSGGKGLHVYAFCGEVQAREARQVAQNILETFGCFDPVRGNNIWKHKHAYEPITIEIFPKQDQASESGLGNLMALPLGKHRLTGQTRTFCDFRCGIAEGWEHLDVQDALEGRLPWGDDPAPSGELEQIRGAASPTPQRSRYSKPEPEPTTLPSTPPSSEGENDSSKELPTMGVWSKKKQPKKTEDRIALIPAEE